MAACRLRLGTNTDRLLSVDTGSRREPGRYVRSTEVQTGEGARQRSCTLPRARQPSTLDSRRSACRAGVWRLHLRGPQLLRARLDGRSRGIQSVPPPLGWGTATRQGTVSCGSSTRPCPRGTMAGGTRSRTIRWRLRTLFARVGTKCSSRMTARILSTPPDKSTPRASTASRGPTSTPRAPSSHAPSRTTTTILTRHTRSSRARSTTILSTRPAISTAIPPWGIGCGSGTAARRAWRGEIVRGMSPATATRSGTARMGGECVTEDAGRCAHECIPRSTCDFPFRTRSLLCVH
ncbi:hypothetical protein T484DRAFT_1972515 [Baffinella frigidus]|nr:hypothetical protein T484DRAFT_1972515 [Cryptophyta sp. CCMP2293]